MKWFERYEILVNNEELNTNQLKKFIGSRHSVAKEFRTNLIAELKNEGIQLENEMRIPTELFLKYIGKNMKYYETKMMQEAKIEKIKQERKKLYE